MIIRTLEIVIKEHLGTGKAIILLGPRQTGKTTLLKKVVSNAGDYLFLDCDDPVVREQLDYPNTQQIRQLLGDARIVFIDEAQRIKNIGLTLKIITDQFKSVQLLVSGSSSLGLSDEINEPLTGRKWEYTMYPISWMELKNHFGHLNSLQQLEQRIIFGMYPDIINHPGKEADLLKQLSNSYLYKDLLAYKGIRKPEVLEKLLRALALQIGQEVSYNELANLIQVDKNTISNYIDLLEKVFIVFRLSPFRRNIRTEIGTSRKIYFYDNGIRNSLIANFNPLNIRQDTGLLWENFLISERMKVLHYGKRIANSYFWRTTQQQEIDYLEERGGKLYAYEFKWTSAKKKKFPETFTSNYPVEKLMVVSKENYLDFFAGDDIA